MYKQRVPLKIIQAGQLTKALKQFYSTQNATGRQTFPLDKCLVVSKLTRFEFERQRHKHLNDAQFEKLLRNRGTKFDVLLEAHRLHKSYEKKVVDALKKVSAEIKVVNRFNYTEQHVKWADIVIPTGGDGTFLLAASRVKTNEKPVMGFNSDPAKSEGHLCVSSEYSKDVDKALLRIKKGDFNWLMRSRIRTSLLGKKGQIKMTNLHCSSDCDFPLSPMNFELGLERGKVLPELALNEVFIGETLSARVSYLEMNLDKADKWTRMKCSGLCVCTGTGSTSWNYSMNRLPSQCVAELLMLIEDNCASDTFEKAKHISAQYNKNLIFHPENTSMAYTIRDLISAGVWPQPKGIQPRGFAEKITIRSGGFDASLVIDGRICFSFNDGAVALLEICPEDALRTIIL